MKIESFHIQGFKSLAAVKVKGLSDINVFYGLNDVGKSNIFEALALWHPVSTATPWKEVEVKFGTPIFQLGSNEAIQVEMVVSLSQPEFPDATILAKGMQTDSQNNRDLGDWISEETTRLASQLASLDKIQITIRMEILSKAKSASYSTTIWTRIGERQYNLSRKDVQFGFHIIEASRRFQIEQSSKSDLSTVSHHNLKKALFYAYLSRDFEQKQRLGAIKKILAEPPFSLGELDIALDPATNQIDIGFVRPDGRLPLENLGSGSRQLLLILGQIFLNDYPIIALEEPEMNLSPQYQQHLLIALRKLMQDPAVKLNQLFISTHSPYFEFEENFFDVTLDEQRHTHVKRLPIEKRDRYFPQTQIGPETGARLNSLNQVRLYDGVIQDLGLRRGDLVLFTKNEAGHWEIRTEDEITEEIEAVLEGGDSE